MTNQTPESVIAEAREALGRINIHAFPNGLAYQYRGGVLGRNVTEILRDVADALEAATRVPVQEGPNDDELANVETELAEWLAGKRSWCDEHHGLPNEIELTAKADEATIRLLITKRDALASRATVPDAALAAHLVLDPEKVRQVIAPLFNNDADGSWGPFSPEDMATRALCQAAKRGELSA